MPPDWLYYIGALTLAIANVIACVGTWYRLPGTWIIVANSLLFSLFFPPKENGLGFGWLTIVLLCAMAAFGQAIDRAGWQPRRTASDANSPSPRLRPLLIGAGAGSFVGVLIGLAVPIIGNLVAIVAAVGGAAGGAWLGTFVPEWLDRRIPERDVRTSERTARRSQPPPSTLSPLAQLVVAVIMLLLSITSSVSG